MGTVLLSISVARSVLSWWHQERPRFSAKLAQSHFRCCCVALVLAVGPLQCLLPSRFGVTHVCLCTKFCAPSQVLFCLLGSKKSDFDWRVKDGRQYRIVQGTSDLQHDHPTKDKSGRIITPTYIRDVGIERVAVFAADCRMRGYVHGGTLSEIQRNRRFHVSENSKEFFAAVASAKNKRKAASDVAPDSECGASKKQKTGDEDSDIEEADEDEGAPEGGGGDVAERGV